VTGRVDYHEDALEQGQVPPTLKTRSRNLKILRPRGLAAWIFSSVLVWYDIRCIGFFQGHIHQPPLYGYLKDNALHLQYAAGKNHHSKGIPTYREET
jgi:hypothetical protein